MIAILPDGKRTPVARPTSSPIRWTLSSTGKPNGTEFCFDTWSRRKSSKSTIADRPSDGSKRKRAERLFRPSVCWKLEGYPFTLIFENDNTARLGVGRPIDSAGRKVVKISICFTFGSTSCDSFESERIR